MADLRREARTPGFPRVILVHQGPAALAEKVLGRLWPEAPAIEDPERVLYKALAIGRMSLWELFRPRLWRQGFRAFRKGFRQTRSGGADTMQLAGAALIVRGRTTWQYHFKGPGDLPDWSPVRGPR